MTATTITPATAARQGGRWQPTLWICLNFEPAMTGCVEHFSPSLRTSANSAVIIELIPAPLYSSALLPPPLASPLPGCPLLICSACSCGMGAERRYCMRVSGGIFRAGIRVWICEWHNFEVSAQTNYQISFKNSISPTSRPHQGFFAV